MATMIMIFIRLPLTAAGCVAEISMDPDRPSYKALSHQASQTAQTDLAALNYWRSLT
jgi:hypothetical protein